MMKLWSDTQSERLAHTVRRLVTEVGYQIGYEPLAALLAERGFMTRPTGRLAPDSRLIDEFVSEQTRRTDARGKKDKRVGRPKRPEKAGDFAPPAFTTGIGNMVSKYHDHDLGRMVPATSAHLDRIVRFADAEPRIARVGLPVSLTDVPVFVAPIEGFLRVVRLTGKYGVGIDPFRPELVRYLAELSDVFLGPGRAAEFIDPCNCINPIMRLETRTAATMMAKAEYGVNSLMTSMPAAGATGPVTIEGSIALGAAEVLGGLIISFAVNSEVDHIGYISSGSLDFKSATTTQSSPESVTIDCGVVSLMEQHFGGNTRAGGLSYVQATRPGLQAVYEKLFKASAYQSHFGTCRFAGGGILDNGSAISPEQLVIDLDIASSFAWNGRVTRDETDLVELIEGLAASADFLSCEQTLSHFREAFWEPTILRRGATKDEPKLLEEAHTYFEDRVASYRPYEYDEEKFRAGEAILRLAGKERPHAV